MSIGLFTISRFESTSALCFKISIPCWLFGYQSYIFHFFFYFVIDNKRDRVFSWHIFALKKLFMSRKPILFHTLLSVSNNGWEVVQWKACSFHVFFFCCDLYLSVYAVCAYDFHFCPIASMLSLWYKSREYIKKKFMSE